MLHDESEQPLLIPVRRVAKRIGIDHRTVRKILPVLRVASHDYILADQLAAWIAERTGGAGGSDNGNPVRA